MIVDKIVNNNIVIAKDFRGREVVAIGKGVGFRKRKNEAVHRSEIMKTYVLLDKVDSGVLTLFEEIQFEVIETSQKIIDYAQEKLNVKFNVNLLMSLSDHINFALIQYRQGNHVPKLVNEEVKRFYKEEYHIGEIAVQMINERFQILFPKDEATAIAFHLITATENKSNHQMMIIMKAVSDIVKIVEDYLNVSLHEDTMAYSRFVIHLKFLFKTVLSKQNVPEVAGMDFIFTQIKSEYKNVIECVKKIADYIMEKFNYRCTDGDCIYLMLHVVRLYETTLN
nr:PRD domain-containing protein [[Ruminococcus] torques]